jgi:hypothetical protein
LVDLTTCWRFSGPVKNYHTDRDEARSSASDVVVQGRSTVSCLSLGAPGAGWLSGGRMDVARNVSGAATAARGKLRSVERGRARRSHVEVWVEKDDERRRRPSCGLSSVRPD